MSDEVVNPNENEQDPNETPEQKADKETKKYLRVIEVVTKVVGGAENLKPIKKVKGDATASIVAELFKEEQEELRKKVKEGLKGLLKQHVQLEADVAAKKKELEKLQLEKRKEFTKAANAWLNQIDQGAVMQAAYGTALEVAFKEKEGEKTNN